MRIRSGWKMLALLAVGGCMSHVGRPGTPNPEPAAWRGLVGCYFGDGSAFVLDTVPEVRSWGGTPGVRMARFVPPAISASYWFVDDRGVVWVYREDGLWGTAYELTTMKGDTLSGRRWVRTDVVSRRSRPVPVVVVRMQRCPPGPAAE